MKKSILLFVITIATVVTFNSCQDGSPGYIYFSADSPTQYCYYFTYYTDNNPGFPVGGYFDTYYSCSAGTYDYEYYVSSSCGYIDYHVWGTYTLSADPGETWDPVTMGVLISGADGQNRYYDLNCEYNGTTLTYKLPQTDPIKFDTTYICKGGAKMRVTGNIVFGEKPPAGLVGKYKK